MCGWCAKDDTEVYEMISGRKGARDFFRERSGVRLLVYLDVGIDKFMIEEEAMRRRLADVGVRREKPCVSYLRMTDLNQLDRQIALGFDPKVVSKKSLYERLRIGRDDRDHDIFAKTTFDALVSRGFAFDEADLIVLDERNEPALKDLPDLIRSEQTIAFV